MSNMSYCKFQNTLSDLRDCADTLEHPDDVLSAEESSAAVSLILSCFRIANLFNEGADEIAVPTKEQIRERLHSAVDGDWDDEADDDDDN